MGYYKKLFIILFLFILFINLFVSFGFCSESVDLTQVDGITIPANSNAFIERSGSNVKYFYAEKGYRYYITLSGGDINRLVVSSDIVPALNVVFSVVADILPNDTFIFVPSENCYVSLSNSTLWSVEKEEISGINGSIKGLVDNVGPNALWGVFGSGIDFVFVIVIVAFGIFIIYKLISGLSKGKSKI